MTSLQPKQLALGLCTLLIISFLYLKTQTVDIDRHNQLLDRIGQFKQVDAILNQHILEIRQGLLPFYDPTAERMAELDRLQGEVTERLRQLLPEPPPAFTRQTTAAQQTLAQKRNLLERFKSSNATLRNSLRYLPLATTRLTARLPAEEPEEGLGEALNRLLRDILVYNMTSEAELGSALSASTRALQHDLARYAPEVQNDLATLLSHVELVLNNKKQVDMLVQKLVTMPIAQRMDGLLQLYTAEYNRMMKSASNYRLALYGISVLLLCYTGYILFRLSLSTSTLQRTITEINQAKEALRESDQRLNDAQRMAHIGSWELDLVTGRLEWSDEVFRIFGVDPEKFEASYETFLAGIHPDDRARVSAAYAESLKNRTPYKIEHRLRMPDGTIKNVLECCKTFFDADGSPIRSVGTVQDITRQRQTEAALRRSQKMDAIGQLSGGIAHDFNNQLGVIIGYLDFLRNHFPEGEKPRQWVDTATRATLRCMDLTRQLLAFSRRQARDRTAIDLNAILRELETMIARSVTPEVSVQYFLADDLWQTETDPGEFQDAILNLVINARDAMPNGGQLLIETRNKQLEEEYALLNPGLEAGDYVQLMLSDTGTGMSKETLEHLFEPFFSTKPEGKGTGLGMAMVYGFVKRHGGYIKAYSEPGMGTTIRIYLPRSTASTASQLTQNGHKAELPTGSESILIVDDEADLLQLADLYLRDLGYRTRLAENAAQALQILAEEGPFDLLFSDVVMPGGMNGYELAEQAVQQHPALKVLLTSGFTSKTIAHNGLSRFSTHLLGKPYRKIDLAQRIRTVLGEESTA